MSKAAESSIWGIHGGKTGDADSLFLNRNCIALGWAKLGDFSIIRPPRTVAKCQISSAPRPARSRPAGTPLCSPVWRRC
jgi:hypothetical protein